MAAHPARAGCLRTALVALGVLLLGAVPVALYTGQQLAARGLGASLSRSLGMPVSVDGLWAALGPSVVIAGLKVGGERPLLQIERTEIFFEPRPSLRPGIRRVRLRRPVLHLEGSRLSRWASQQPVRASRRIQGAARRRRALELVIEDGALRIEHRWRGQLLCLRSTGVRLAAGSPARLVLGPTQLTRGGEVLFEASALALDLDRARGWRPLRAALLGGSLRLPGGAVLTLHSLALRPTASGYLLSAMGKPGGQESGRLKVRARLDHRLRPIAPDGVALQLQNVALGQLAPSLEPLGWQLGESRVEGTARLLSVEGGYRVELDMEARQLRLLDPRISRQSIGPFGGELHGNLLLDPDHGEVRDVDLRLALGRIVLAIRGDAQVDEGGTRLSFDARLPPVPCQQVLMSIPAGLAPALAGMGVDGTMGLKARLLVDTRDLEATEVELLPDPLGCRVVADPPHADVRKLLGAITIRVSGPRGTGAPWLLGRRNPDYRPLGRISSHLRDAFLVAEDWRFFQHQGFDAKQLRRAFISNLKEGRLARGASTISQQLIKNIYLGNERTLARKLQEAVLTWRLEQVVPKQRILELYLNLVEMGPGVYGVGQAARTYFKEDAAHLGPLEAAKLAALTPSPRHLAQRLREGNPGQAMLERVQVLLRLMRRRTEGRRPDGAPSPQKTASLPDIASVLR